MRSHLIEVYAQERPGPFDCSIVVPIYNGSRFLDRAIPSVLQQAGIACDIVISDDCSDDGSLDAVLEAVKTYSGPHAVRVYRTSRPAVSEHIPLLVDASRSDRIIQAHQDDVSYPVRARFLAEALSGRTRLVTSVARTRSEAGLFQPTRSQIARLRKNASFRKFLMSGMDVIIGARFGMHRDIFDRFPKLSWDYLSHGQDILLYIRANMIGTSRVIYRPLLEIGDHPGRGTYQLFDMQDPATRDFDYCLRRIVILGVALNDLAHLRATGQGHPPRMDFVERHLLAARLSFVEILARNRELAIQRGFKLKWTRTSTR
jgi:glycosyltransferase involved in cell wall biosynthesis